MLVQLFELTILTSSTASCPTSAQYSSSVLLSNEHLHELRSLYSAVHTIHNATVCANIQSCSSNDVRSQVIATAVVGRTHILYAHTDSYNTSGSSTHP